MITNMDESIEQFCSELSYLLYTLPSSDKVILMGDFNTYIGHDNTYWKWVLGEAWYQ